MGADIRVPGTSGVSGYVYFGKGRNIMNIGLLPKQDSHLAIAGAVKARGGIYEVLKHTEDIFLEPSACAAFQGPIRLNQEENVKEYLKAQGLVEKNGKCHTYCMGNRWKSCAGRNPSAAASAVCGRDHLPVVSISWYYSAFTSPSY